MGGGHYDLIGYKFFSLLYDKDIENKVKDIFDNNGRVNNIPIIDSNGNLLYEYMRKITTDTTKILLPIWKQKYINIENIKKYLSLYENSIQKIILINNKTSKEEFNKIIYGLENYIIINNEKEFENIINNNKKSIIFSFIESNIVEKMYENIIKPNSNLVEFMDIINMCKNIILDKFFDKYKERGFKLYFFESMNYDKNLKEQYFTKEEIKRIEQERSNRFFLTNKEYDKDVKLFFKDEYSKEFIDNIFEQPSPIIENTYFIQPNYKSKYFNVIGKERLTTNLPQNCDNPIICLGSCIMYGVLVKDNNTIPSYLQKLCNKNIKNNNFYMINCGVRGINMIERMEYVINNYFDNNSVLIFIIDDIDKKVLLKKLKELKLENKIIIHDLQLLFKDRNKIGCYFLDRPIHCNHIANKIIANYIYDILNKDGIFNQVENNNNLSNEYSKSDFNIVFKENIELKNYLSSLEKYKQKDELEIGCIVMNCNPFTKGHRFLIEEASKRVNKLFIFVVEENKSFFDFDTRMKLVKQGIKDIENVIVIPSGNFIISSVTFPEYFQKDSNKDVSIDTSLDIDVFGQHIAPLLNIKYRFVGTEPFDNITKQYNITMKRLLPKYGVELIEIPRCELNNQVISASLVRKLLKEKNFNEINNLVPESTYKYLYDIYN